MKRVFGSAAVCFLVIVVGVLQGEPASTAPKLSPATVAVLDMSYVFKYHKAFGVRMNELKENVLHAENKFKAKRDELTKRDERLKELGSDEAKDEERKVTREKADLQAATTEMKEEFMRQEARIYMLTYREIADVVEKHSREHDISLVFRFSSEPMDEKNRESVLREINKPIVFQDGLDITAEILRLVNSEKQKES